MRMVKIGSHVSFSDKGLLSATKEAVEYGGNTFMIYTGAPQNTRRKPIEELYIEEGRAAMAAAGINEIVVHAPYIINLGSYKEDTFELAVNFLQEEIRRTAALGVRNIVLHPGAYTDKDATYGLARIAEGLNEVLAGTRGMDVNIALETMAGKGTEMGRNFDEIATMIDKVTDNERLSVCLDTCHVHDAGYDLVNDLDGVLTEFDRIVGLDRIAVVHINDSKNPRGASKDRHATLGSGYLGYQTIHNIVHHEQLQGRPFILETPWIGSDDKTVRPMYSTEIALLSGVAQTKYDPSFHDDVDQLAALFKTESIATRAFIIETWDMLKGDAKARKADPREPMERLYELVVQRGVLSGVSEEGINQRLTALFARG